MVAKKKATKKKAAATKKPAKHKPIVLTLAELEQTVVQAEQFELRIQAYKQALSVARADIRKTMESKNLKLTFAMDKRLQAQLVEQDTYSWFVDELRRYLTPAEFKKYVPPTPKAADLRKLIEADAPIATALKKGCFKKSKQVLLVIERVKADTLKANIVKAAEHKKDLARA